MAQWITSFYFGFITVTDSQVCRSDIAIGAFDLMCKIGVYRTGIGDETECLSNNPSLILLFLWL